MPAGIAVAFIVVFALILLAVSVALKFFDARRKKQVNDMLQTASGDAVVTMSNLLKEIDAEKPTGFKAMVTSLQFSRHAQEQIQQAGLNWSSSRLLAAMGLMAIPGLGIGTLMPFMFNGPVTAIVLAAGLRSAPLSLRAAEAKEAVGRAWKSSFRKRSISWRDPCARDTPSPSACRWWARRL